MSSAPRSIPGRPLSPKDDLQKKYRKVIEMQGRLDMLEYHKRSEDGTTYYKVKVKLDLKQELTDKEGWQIIMVGTGENDKDFKGAYKDLLESELDVEVDTTDEKKIRQLAYNVVTKRYNSIAKETAAIINEDVSNGKAVVKVKVKDGSLVAEGKGAQFDDAYKIAKPTP